MQRDRPEDRTDNMRGAFTVVYVFLYAWALSVFLPLRRDSGHRAIGVAGLLALLLILGFGQMTRCIALYYYAGWFLLAILAHRMGHFRHKLAGIAIHSRYPGYPWLGYRLRPKAANDLKAAEAECCFVIGVGAVLTQLVPPLGVYLVFGGLAAIAVECINVEARKRRVQEFNDARMEQEALAAEIQNQRRLQ